MNMTTETLLERHSPRTFVERIRHTDSLTVHLIKTYDHAARPCWFLLKASERNLIRLEQTVYQDMIDLTQFGVVVASGWGHEPDEKELKSFFSPAS